MTRAMTLEEQYWRKQIASEVEALAKPPLPLMVPYGLVLRVIRTGSRN